MPQSEGPSVDANLDPVIDPTKNVLDLFEAGQLRADDLRTADRRMSEAKLDHLEKTAALRADYDEKLREAEAKRIDAIRAVDVNAVNVASTRAADQAAVLATQVASSAEALRALVATSAAALATQQTQIITPIMDRLALIERAQYEGVGKNLIQDPQMAQLLNEMRVQREITANSMGHDNGTTLIWAYVITASGAIVGIVGLIFALTK